MKISQDGLLLLLLEYHRGSDVNEVAVQISTMKGSGTVHRIVISHLFARFKSSDFFLDEDAHTGRPAKVDINGLSTLVEADRHQLTLCLAEQLGYHFTTVSQLLHGLSKT